MQERFISVMYYYNYYYMTEIWVKKNFVIVQYYFSLMTGVIFFFNIMSWLLFIIIWLRLCCIWLLFILLFQWN